MTDNSKTDIDIAIDYHERTKHYPNRYARSLGFLDWENQPDPFRKYEGALLHKLELPEAIAGGPSFSSLYRPTDTASARLDSGSVSELFYYSLALSAWKQAPHMPRWSLRVNPSSGNLHPTEAYLIAGPINGLTSQPAVFHYSPVLHNLEQRLVLPPEVWRDLKGDLPDDTLLVALSSIYWREAWKYGERAYRYCQHDVGHAIAAVGFSAATLGWSCRVVPLVTDEELAQLLGIADQHGPEAEHPDCLLALSPQPMSAAPGISVSDDLLERLKKAEFTGQPNQISKQHHDWPAIDRVASACTYSTSTVPDGTADAVNLPAAAGDGPPARRIIRRRRSAMAMDGDSWLTGEQFYTTIARLLPERTPFPYDTLGAAPEVSLAVFVNRVKGLVPGLYLLARHPDHVDDLKVTLKATFAWSQPDGCPADLPFFLLETGDFEDTSGEICCKQEIVAAGAFSVGMLARFEEPLKTQGAWKYPRLFWETGVIGQVLYLEAEAIELSGTGIGCFFDDLMHDLLGLSDLSWQSLYHFTVGGALIDKRLATIPAYDHLTQGG